MKAYIKYKINNIKVVMIIMSLLSIFYIAGIFSRMEFTNYIAGGTYFLNRINIAKANMDIGLMICSFFLGIRTMQNVNDLCEKELPYKTTKRFANSFILGVLVILIQWIAVSVAATVFFFRYKDLFSEWNLTSKYYSELMKMDNLGNGLMFIASIYLCCLVIFSVTAVSTTIFKNYFAALLGTVGCFILPLFVVETIRKIGLHSFGKDMMYLNWLNKFNIFLSNYSQRNVGTTHINMAYISVDNDMKYKCIIMAAMSILLYIFAVVLIKNVDGTSGKITLSLWIDRFLVVLFGILVSMILPYMYIFKKINGIGLIFIMVFMAAVVTFIVNKLFGTSKKYEFLNARKN